MPNIPAHRQRGTQSVIPNDDQYCLQNHYKIAVLASPLKWLVPGCNLEG